MKKSYNTYLIVIIFITLSFFQFANFNIVLADSEEFFADIRDNKGVIDTVKNLRARYAARGSWIGKVPENDLPFLTFTYYEKEGRVTYDKTIKITFSEIKKLKYKHFENKKYIGQYVIEKKDGQTILLNSNSYEVKDINGNTLSSAQLEKYHAKIGKNTELFLDGFKGVVEKDGKKGKYYIPINEVEEINFK